jgi:predicted nucleotide-binding protein (sugar kinase/HSP70/actin superfamily)
MSARTYLVGPLGRTHDTLLAAALRGLGLHAVPLHPPTDAAMRAARALGNHGQCNPPHYAAGAVLEHARASHLAAADFAASHAWLTLGSCGPCRLAAFQVEWRRIFCAAGLGALEVMPFEQAGFAQAFGGRGAADAAASALAAADVLEALARRSRPRAVDAGELERALDRGVLDVTSALEHGRPVAAALGEAGRRARALALTADRRLPRVLLLGEPWTALVPGAPSYDVVRRLGRAGALVRGAKSIEWLRYLAWQLARSHRAPKESQAAAARAYRRLGALWRHHAGAAGVDEPLEDLDHLAAVAAPWYPADALGGSGHLEVGRALAAAQERSAELVISIKPFGCLPSSSVSDGVLGPLLRQLHGAPAFLTLETTGDAHATVESRLEMALHTATLRAMECQRTAGSAATGGASPGSASA